jgi:hypothetical protein
LIQGVIHLLNGAIFASRNAAILSAVGDFNSIVDTHLGDAGIQRGNPFITSLITLLGIAIVTAAFSEVDASLTVVKHGVSALTIAELFGDAQIVLRLTQGERIRI